MLRTPTQLLSHAFYYFLQIIGGIVGLIGVFSIKAVPIVLCIAIIEYFGKKFDWIILIGGSIVGIAFIGWPIGKLVIELALKISDHSEKYKYGFLEIFGSNFKEPQFSDFDLTKEQYYSYNRRFKFDLIAMLLSWGAVFGTMYWYGSRHSERGVLVALFILTLAGTAGLSVYSLMLLANNAIARRYPQHIHVRNYDRAKRIYEGIQKELREKQLKQKYAEKKIERTFWQKVRAAIWD